MWEFVNRRPLRYPAPRYQSPIFMHPESFAWAAQSDQPGVCYKRLAALSERGASIGFARLDSGAVMRAAPASIYFVTSGSGRADAQAWHARSTLYFAPGEAGEISAEQPSELLHIGLPDLADLPRHSESATPAGDTALRT